MLTFLSKYRFFLGYMLVCSIYALPLFGQTMVDYEHLPIEQKQFDDAEWQTLQKSLDYSGEKPKEEEEEKKEEKEPFRFPDFSRFSVLFKIIAILILVGLLSFIVYEMVKKTDLAFEPATDLPPNYQTNKKLVSLEEQLDKHDLSPYIDKAEQARNYPLAVRLYFLALLKKMNEKELILWKKNYTNNTYLNQMREKDAYIDFKILTKAYERIWYGDRHPAFPEYDILRKQFMAFLSDIK